MMKTFFSLLIAFFIILPYGNGFCKEPYPPLNISTNYAVVMDADSGRILYEKNASKIVPMASTTKIMTCILAIENCSLDEIVTVSKAASSIHGSTIGLRYGEKLTMEEMLYGLMLRSGNDCAVAIAEHISGSVEAFSNLMNAKAFSIGAFNTHFSSPHGLDSNDHFTTSRDLALITRYAFKYDTFSKIVSTKTITFDHGKYKRSFSNTNRLLWSIPDADGVKTGYTGKAGRCLVSSASRNSSRFICVLLNSQNRWEDSKKLLNYALNNYTEKIEIDPEKLKSKIEVINGQKQKIEVGFKEKISIPLTQSEKESLSMRLMVPSSVTAPVYEGEQLGSLLLYCNDKIIYSVPYTALYGSRVSASKTLLDKILRR
jgi:D-alanyl-D-alanine carboxypeptidase (penicillin-binding protein 5/6)